MLVGRISDWNFHFMEKVSTCCWQVGQNTLNMLLLTDLFLNLLDHEKKSQHFRTNFDGRRMTIEEPLQRGCIICQHCFLNLAFVSTFHTDPTNTKWQISLVGPSADLLFSILQCHNGTTMMMTWSRMSETIGGCKIWIYDKLQDQWNSPCCFLL